MTQQVVGTLAIEFPGKNIVMSNVGYTFTGTPLAKSNIVYNAKVGSDVTYASPPSKAQELKSEIEDWGMLLEGIGS